MFLKYRPLFSGLSFKHAKRFYFHKHSHTHTSIHTHTNNILYFRLMLYLLNNNIIDKHTSFKKRKQKYQQQIW